MNHDTENNENLSLDDEEVNDSSESVSSSEYVPVLADVQVSQKLVPESKTKSLTITVQKDYPRSALRMLCGLFIVIFAAFLCLLWIGGDQDECYNLLPT